MIVCNNYHKFILLSKIEKIVKCKHFTFQLCIQILVLEAYKFVEGK